MVKFKGLMAALAFAGLLSGIAPAAYAEGPTPGAVAPVTQSFGAWQGRCEQNQAGTETCTIAFEVKSEQSQQTVLFFGIGKRPGEGHFSFILLPLGVALPVGVQISVDGTELARIPYQVCIPSGCQAGFGPTDEFLQKIKAGNEMTISVVDIRQGAITLNVSLSGVTAALNWLDTKHPG
ncbi:MAG: invasion associated locus B family protein [Parvibaculaceae bacterium]